MAWFESIIQALHLPVPNKQSVMPGYRILAWAIVGQRKRKTEAEASAVISEPTP